MGGTTSTPAAEKRNFKMHPQLLFDVIRRQAGTLGKAVLEGVMNAVDAGATRCDIKLEKRSLTITDDGKGFRDRSEIENFFEVFGQPHTAAENKTYGTFRMGRGQLFAFGHNIWRSGNFMMDVDIWHKGLDYDLSQLKENKPGCGIAVSLYNELIPSAVADVEREVAKFVKWVNIRVYCNGLLISKDPATVKWTEQDDCCQMKFKETGGLAVYNLGVLVKEFPESEFGVSGDALSKTTMQVNFARNDVMDTCPVWKQMRKYINKAAGKVIAKSPSMTDGQREKLARQICQGESIDGVENLRLFTDVSGRQWAMKSLRYTRLPFYTEAKAGDRLGDKLQQQKLAFVFSNVTLSRFNVPNAKELMALITRTDPDPYPQDHYTWKYKTFAALCQGLNTTYSLLGDDELTVNEGVARAVSEHLVYALQPFMANNTMVARRKILIGESDHANGWTDGQTYIAIARAFLKKQDIGTLPGVLRLANLLVHELCHDDLDTDTHVHSPEFYQAYHDTTMSDCFATTVASTLTYLPKFLETQSRRLTKRQLHDADKLARAELARTKVRAKETASVQTRISKTGTERESRQSDDPGHQAAQCDGAQPAQERATQRPLPLRERRKV